MKMHLEVSPYRCVHRPLPVAVSAYRSRSHHISCPYLCSSIDRGGCESSRSEQLRLLENGRTNDWSAQEGLSEGGSPQGLGSKSGIHLELRVRTNQLSGDCCAEIGGVRGDLELDKYSPWRLSRDRHLRLQLALEALALALSMTSGL